MPTLKMRDEREWRRLLSSKMVSLSETEVGDADFTDFGNPDTLKAAAKLIDFPAEAVLDLVCAYDKGDALGGRAWLESNADSGQLWIIFQRALLVVFPFVTSVASLLSEIRKGTSESGLVSSLTNGHSLTGTAVQPN